MYAVTSQEMRAIDRHTIEHIGIPSLVLMENAGRAVAEEVIRFSEEKGLRKWVIMAGKGNNGADGIVAARHLWERGFEVFVLFAADPKTFSEEGGVQYRILKQIGLPHSLYVPGSFDWRDYDGAIDALLGTGTSGAPRGNAAEMIREVNASGLPVISVDIPSGLNADTGQVHEPCIRAAVTVCLAFLKRGLLQYPGVEHAGVCRVKPIGIPLFLAEQFGVKTLFIDENVLRDRFHFSRYERRSPNTHKGTYGHVLVIAGSATMAGAGQLCSLAALRSGCGLVTWAVPKGLYPSLAGKIPEIMLQPLGDSTADSWSGIAADEVLKLAEGKKALIIGPGLGRWTGDLDWLKEIWENAPCPMVVDADALNILAEAPDFANWKKRKSPAVLTPHPGEMARLSGISTADVQKDRIGLTQKMAETWESVVVLKGAGTVCADPDGKTYIQLCGNPGMATGGSGDVLAGMIGGLLAQGFRPIEAALIGVHLHGSAGDRAAQAKRYAASLIASDILEYL